MDGFGRPARPPSHIVVLRDGIEVWADLGPVFGGVEKSFDLEWDRTVLVPKDPATGVATVYRRFDIMTADLSPAEVAQLRLHPRVRAVRSNARHTLPVEASRVVGAAPAPLHSWCLDKVGIPPGYSTRTGRGVRVAVLDSGIAAHPDLDGRVKAKRRFVYGGTGYSDVDDDTGHGTGVAGVIAGPVASIGNMRYGVAPEVELVIGKVIDKGKYDDDDVIAGINWATHPDQGAVLVCLSLWERRAMGAPFLVCFDRIAERLRAETPGAVVIAAAGNGSDRSNHRIDPVANPAACPHILAVAAITESYEPSITSCGEADAVDSLDYAAPGVMVRTAALNGKFSDQQGTSFAAPHVIGIAALRLEELEAGLGGAKPRAVDVLKPLASKVHTLQPPTDFGAGIPLAP